MSEENLLPNGDNAHRRLVSFVLVLTVAIGVLIAAQLATGGSSAESTASAQASPSIGRDVTESSSDEDDRAGTIRSAGAEEALREFLIASDRSFQRADGTSLDVKPFATQAMVDEVRNESLNLESQGITQRGNTTVVDMSALRSTDSEIVIGVCLSTSKVKTLDRAGSDLRASQGQAVRSMHHYTVILVDDTWKVSAHSFPDNADC